MAKLQRTYGEEPKTLQTQVMRRFIPDAEWNKLLRRYRANRKRGTVKREETLSLPITAEDRALLRFYIEETDVSLKQKAEELGFTSGKLFGKVVRTALKLLYQNPNGVKLQDLK